MKARHIHTLTLALLVSLSGQAKAQYWAPIGDFDLAVRDFSVDTTHNLLYACGFFKEEGDSLLNNIAVYDGTIWDNVGNGSGDSTWALNNLIYDVEYHDGQLFAAGQFLRVDGANYPIWDPARAARWDGTDWVGCGYPNYQAAFGVANGQLFAMGGFDTIGGQPINNIARWTGIGWSPLGTVPPPYLNGPDDIVTACAYYRGSHYVAGNFEYAEGYKEIMRWDGTEWSPLELGILGEAWVAKLVVYKGLLFVAGFFTQAAGNAGNHIMAWDGERWLDPFPNVHFQYQIRDLQVINGELYIASGSFFIPGKTGVHQLAKYDGSQFCLFGPCATKPINDLAYYHGSLILTSSWFYNSPTDSIPFAAEWIGGNSTDTCITQLIGVDNAEMVHHSLAVSPNPGTGDYTVTLDAAHSGDMKLQVCNLQGKMLREEMHFVRQGKNEILLDLSMLASGVYFVHLEDEKGTASAKLIKL